MDTPANEITPTETSTPPAAAAPPESSIETTTPAAAVIDVPTAEPDEREARFIALETRLTRLEGLPSIAVLLARG